VPHAITNWHVDRPRAPEWERWWLELYGQMRTAFGFGSATLLRSTEHPGKYVTTTVWAERADWDRFYGDDEVRCVFRKMFPLLKGPPVQEWFDPLPSATPSPRASE